VTSGGRSVGIVRLRAQATEFLVFVMKGAVFTVILVGVLVNISQTDTRQEIHKKIRGTSAQTKQKQQQKQ
jgi:hypothetical protein